MTTLAQYSIPNTTTAAPGNELGIYESDNVHYSRVDLDVYFSTLYPYVTFLPFSPGPSPILNFSNT